MKRCHSGCVGLLLLCVASLTGRPEELLKKAEEELAHVAAVGSNEESVEDAPPSRRLFAYSNHLLERSKPSIGNRVEGNWKQAKGKIKEQWGKLTDDDLDVINGKRDQLEGKSRSDTATRKIG